MSDDLPFLVAGLLMIALAIIAVRASRIEHVRAPEPIEHPEKIPEPAPQPMPSTPPKASPAVAKPESKPEARPAVRKPAADTRHPPKHHR